MNRTQPPEAGNLRGIRVLLILLFIAVPALGALISVIQVVRDNVGGVSGLDGVTAVAVAPYGSQVYATGMYSGALTVFNRHPTTGTLSFVEVHEDGIGGIFGLLGASDVAASLDERHVYATAQWDDTLVVFSRDATMDDLAFVAAQVKEEGVGGLNGLDGASAVTLSPDDEHVLVASRVSDAVMVFARDASQDDLTFVDVESAETLGTADLDGASDIAVSPDGAHVYVTAEIADRISIFTRDAATGGVEFILRVEDSDSGANLDGASGIVVSSDGLHVYATAAVDNAVTAFSRDSITGALSVIEVYSTAAGITGLQGARDVSINPSGDRVLVAGADDNAITIFLRDPGSGKLEFLDLLTDGDGGVDGLAGARAVETYADHAYAAGHEEATIAVIDLPLCEGDETTGDTDNDGVCDDSDACPGSIDARDGDNDGVPDDCDFCTGNDTTDDSDDDGVCDNLDTCAGFDDAVDSDGDGIADGCDLCTGNNGTGDNDTDGICDNLDACPGFNDALDGDGDGVPDDCDPCTGDNASGDSDGDGVCDDSDPCPNDAPNTCGIFSDSFESGDVNHWS